VVVKLNRKSVFARFYLLAGDEWNLPEDFCSFFWGLVERALKVIIFVAVCLFIICFFVYGVIHVVMAGWRHPTISATALASAFVIAGGFWLAYRRGVASAASDLLKIVNTKIDSVRNRYCLRIEWH